MKVVTESLELTWLLPVATCAPLAAPLASASDSRPLCLQQSILASILINA